MRRRRKAAAACCPCGRSTFPRKTTAVSSDTFSLWQDGPTRRASSQCLSCSIYHKGQHLRVPCRPKRRRRRGSARAQRTFHDLDHCFRHRTACIVGGALACGLRSRAARLSLWFNAPGVVAPPVAGEHDFANAPDSLDATGTAPTSQAAVDGDPDAHSSCVEQRWQTRQPGF